MPGVQIPGVRNFQIHSPRRTINQAMSVLRYIAAGFINFFSITQPAPGTENRAALFIAAMLAAVIAFVVVVIGVAVHVLSH